MGLPNKPFEHTRPQTITTPVNKPREAQSLWELPTLRPSGGAQSCWPWYYIYNYIILYTIIYRAQRVANSNNHFLLHAAVHPGLHCTALSLTVERWLAVTLHMSLSCHAVERWLAVITRNSRQSLNISTSANLSPHKSLWTLWPVHSESVARQIKTFRRFSLAKDSPDTRLYVHFVWDLVAPSRLVWTHSERTGEVSRRTAKIDIFIQKIAGPFASCKKHVCDDNDMDTSSSLHVEGHTR